MSTRLFSLIFFILSSSYAERNILLFSLVDVLFSWSMALTESLMTVSVLRGEQNKYT